MNALPNRPGCVRHALKRAEIFEFKSSRGLSSGTKATAFCYASMSFNNPSVRAAYRQGAKDCYLSAVPHLNPSVEIQVQEWLRALEAWNFGPPPAPPHSWSSNVIPFKDS